MPFVHTPSTGVWQPTPPAFLPVLTPWLGAMKPLLLNSASQFRPGPPPAIDSHQYARDYNETRLYGALNGSLRTTQQTETALFGPKTRPSCTTGRSAASSPPTA